MVAMKRDPRCVPMGPGSVLLCAAKGANCGWSSVPMGSERSECALSERWDSRNEKNSSKMTSVASCDVRKRWSIERNHCLGWTLSRSAGTVLEEEGSCSNTKFDALRAQS